MLVAWDNRLNATIVADFHCCWEAAQTEPAWSMPMQEEGRAGDRGCLLFG